MKQKASLKNVALWLLVAAITVVALFFTYNYDVSAPVKIIIWLGWLVLSGVTAFFTSTGQQVYSFAKEAKIELQKVFWPTRQETIQTTSIVMIMVTLTGFILWGVDTIMMWVIAKITHLG